MSNIRKINTYIDTPSGIVQQEIHPITETKAVVDMDLALDSYTESFIKPYVDAKFDSVMLAYMPIGYIFPWASNVNPDGCLKLNGAILDRETYNLLWKFAEDSGNIITESAWTTQSNSQTSVGHFSTGDGSTTFRLPKIVDFIRGQSSSDNIGRFQEFDTASHNHANGGTAASAGSHAHNMYTNSGSGTGILGLGSGFPNQGRSDSQYIISGGAHTHTLSGNTGNRGGTETRPSNIAYPYYIKAFHPGTLAYGIPSGGIIMWSGTLVNIPDGWALCDGTNGTPNLLDRFVCGVANASTNPGTTGGAHTKIMVAAEMPRHRHSLTTGTAASAGSHNHSMDLTGFTSGSSSTGWNPVSASWKHSAAPNTSSNGAHTHTLSGNSDYDKTTAATAFDVRPSYYALAFIMKL